MFATMAMFWLASTDSASAYVYAGNPALTIHVERNEADLLAGSGVLKGVRVYICGGGYDDYEVDESIDPVEGWSTTIEGGDLCGVAVRWDSDVDLWATSFSVRYEELVTAVTLTGASSDDVAFTPLVVTAGTFSGSAPRLVVTIQ